MPANTVPLRRRSSRSTGHRVGPAVALVDQPEARSAGHWTTSSWCSWRRRAGPRGPSTTSPHRARSSLGFRAVPKPPGMEHRRVPGHAADEVAEVPEASRGTARSGSPSSELEDDVVAAREMVVPEERQLLLRAPLRAAHLLQPPALHAPEGVEVVVLGRRALCAFAPSRSAPRSGGPGPRAADVAGRGPKRLGAGRSACSPRDQSPPRRPPRRRTHPQVRPEPPWGAPTLSAPLSESCGKSHNPGGRDLPP
jgi:hypothetical protein